MNTSIKPKTYEVNAKGHLELGGIDIVSLAAEYGTPLYVIDEDTLRENCRSFCRILDEKKVDYLMAYAGKANLNVGLLNILADENFGVDVVSGGEIYTALKSRIKKENIVVHGNNKSVEELTYSLENQLRIVLDNETELETVIRLSKELGERANVMIRIKPEIEAHTHDYIKTGQIDSKFGIDQGSVIENVKRLGSEPSINFLGIHSHIGSQIFDILPYKDLTRLMVSHLEKIKNETGVELKELNLGGGFGIRYVEKDDPPKITDFLNEIVDEFIVQCKAKNLKMPKLIFEPGRSVIGNAGITLYSIGTIKDIPRIKEYIFVDGGMADNPRPILYQSEYTFVLGNKLNEKTGKIYTIAGKFCESGDVLAEGVALPEAEMGDLLVVFGTGAYNYSMASNYNRFRKPAMVSVSNGKVSTLVRRETYEDVVRLDVV
jgi:diaminopimelate decarboxylase